MRYRVSRHASAGDVTSRDLRWCMQQMNKNVRAHDGNAVSKGVKDWEKEPRLPMVIRSGRANKSDGKIWESPGMEGAGECGPGGGAEA
ncbi:hypothetical protein MLD38_011123 [Melastoma candidum]|uniref:Uncharacterized protein n=1 Tax=Melastoma candidum TaxID=119954 RepID=A0ACB9R252_9MYRT|nr:hypothetical protein MLD38_011123 [Melastoma candidum]